MSNHASIWKSGYMFGARSADTAEIDAMYARYCVDFPGATATEPQPAADTRVVTVAQLQTWMGYTSEHGGAAKFVKEIRAIIGGASL